MSVPLDHDEAKLMRQSSIIADRFVKSYELILNFFGMELNNKTGAVRRHHDEKFWNERYKNLERNGHNLLRITRIITSLGHFGFHSWKKPFIDFLKIEIMENDHFGSMAKTSLIDHWFPLLDVDSKDYLVKTDETIEDREDSIYFKYLLDYNKDTDSDENMKEKEKVKDEDEDGTKNIKDKDEEMKEKEKEKDEELKEKEKAKS